LAQEISTLLGKGNPWARLLGVQHEGNTESPWKILPLAHGLENGYQRRKVWSRRHWMWKGRVAVADCLPRSKEAAVQLLLPLCSSAALPKAFEAPGRAAAGEGARSPVRGPVPERPVPSGLRSGKRAPARLRPPSQGRSPWWFLPGPPFLTSSLWMVLWQLGSFCRSWGTGGPGTQHTGTPVLRYPSTQVPQQAGILAHEHPSTQVPQQSGILAHEYPSTQVPQQAGILAQRYPSTPVPMVHSAPAHRYPITSVPQHTKTPAHQYRMVHSALAHRYPITRVPQNTGTPALWYPSAPVHVVHSAPAHRYPSKQVSWHTGAPVLR